MNIRLLAQAAVAGAIYLRYLGMQLLGNAMLAIMPTYTEPLPIINASKNMLRTRHVSILPVISPSVPVGAPYAVS